LSDDITLDVPVARALFFEVGMMCWSMLGMCFNVSCVFFINGKKQDRKENYGLMKDTP
jgi:hypothetical protein